MDSLTLLRENLADLTSYSLLAVGLLLLGFLGLELVTPGNLRNKIWREGNRSAVILAVQEKMGKPEFYKALNELPGRKELNGLH